MARPTQVTALLMLLSLAGCSRESSGGGVTESFDKTVNALRDNAPLTEMAPTAGLAAPATPSPFPRLEADALTTGAMIIRSGTASVRIDSLEPAMTAVEALAARLGGYLANSQVQAGANRPRAATLEIRVPSERFQELTSGLTPIGSLESLNVNALDVGEEFTDLSARVQNGHRLEARLIELLATRTGKLSDVLEIERELARVREEIERMEGRMRYLQRHAATSSLSVTIHEPYPVVGDTGSLGVILESFRTAWRNFVAFVAAAIASLGVIAPVGLLVGTAIWGVRHRLRRRVAA